MPNVLIIDTSIYRELGLRFYQNIDYRNLCNFAFATNIEVSISSIVIEEFENYYQTTLLKKYSDYNNSIENLNRDPFFKAAAEFPNLQDQVKNALEKFGRQLRSDPNHNSPISLLPNWYIDGLLLTKFILESKNQGINNVQVRDYLIWNTVVSVALQESKDRVEKIVTRKIKLKKGKVFFITKDKIFSESELFLKRKQELKIDNIEVFHSIPQFLHTKGYNIPFVTSELILSKISNVKILKDLDRDIGALLSYVSPKYNNEECNKRSIELEEIINKDIIEFYSYLDDADGKAKYVAHLKVHVNVVFEKDSYEIEPGRKYGRYLETYDAIGRPFYSAPILFIYRGLIDIEREIIKSVQFIDFMPDLYI